LSFGVDAEDRQLLECGVGEFELELWPYVEVVELLGEGSVDGVLARRAHKD